MDMPTFQDKTARHCRQDDADAVAQVHRAVRSQWWQAAASCRCREQHGRCRWSAGDGPGPAAVALGFVGPRRQPHGCRCSKHAGPHPCCFGGFKILRLCVHASLRARGARANALELPCACVVGCGLWAVGCVLWGASVVNPTHCPVFKCRLLWLINAPSAFRRARRTSPCTVKAYSRDDVTVICQCSLRG